MTRTKTLGLIAILLWVAFACCGGIVGVLTYQIRTAPVEYTEVAVLVTDIRSEPGVLSRSSHVVVTVRYEGKEYELISVLDGEVPQYQAGYETGMPVTVYLANGELYSNINGIKSHNAKGKANGVIFSAAGVLFLAAVTVTGTYVDKVRKGATGAAKSSAKTSAKTSARKGGAA